MAEWTEIEVDEKLVAQMLLLGLAEYDKRDGALVVTEKGSQVIRDYCDKRIAEAKPNG